MATLQKIRSRGALLIIAVGLALFAFIAEEFVRSLSTQRNENRQRLGEVYGESLNVQEFGELVEEYTDVVKFTSGMDNLTEEQAQQVRDQVWNSYVQTKLIEHEANELGLTVTDAELQQIIQQGHNPMLMQTPFSNPQTGSFDYQALNKFLTDYKAIKGQPNQPAEAVEYYTKVYNYWKFIEKNIRQQTLATKYQSLLTKAFITNPTAIEQAFKANSEEKNVLLASVPYSSIKDEEINVETSDLKSKYNELKDQFRLDGPTRDIKYIDVAITASKADRDQISQEMAEVAGQLAAEDADYATIVRKSGSVVAFSALPLRRTALPSDVAAQVDSMSVGTQKGPYVNAADNTQNIVRLLGKVSQADSVQFRQIGVIGADEAAIKKTADSIMTALAAGAPFDSIAKKYNQTGAEQWLTSAQFEGSSIDENNQAFIRAILNQAVGTTEQVKIGTNVVIIRVTDKRNFVDKYNVAIVKRPIDFSNETYNKTYNDFSQFIASNKTLEEIEANAVKAGYMVSERKDLSGNEHNLAGVSSTREALRWAFKDDTKVGEVSEIYTCGNNDHLLAIIVTGKNDGDFRTLESVKDYLQSEVLRDKKAVRIMESMEKCNDWAAATKLTGVLPIDTINHVNFSAPVFVSSFGASEPALSGAIAKTAKGQFVKCVKGNGAVYAFKVIDEHNHGNKLDDAAKETAKQQINTRNMRAMSRFMQELYERADVKDKRYLFY